MREEEKRAIEDLKEEIEYYKRKYFNSKDDEEYNDKILYSIRLSVKDSEVLVNLIEKLKKENEELKNKVVKRDNEIIQLEESAEKEFLTKQEVKENYIPKDKIRELIKKDSEIDKVEFEDDYDLNYERKIIDVDYTEELLEEY